MPWQIQDPATPWEQAALQLLDLEHLLTSLKQPGAAPPAAAICSFSFPVNHLQSPHYSNSNSRLGIEFQVWKLPFTGLQVIDPRLVVIAPAACNEKHRHAHESIFVVLSGSADILIGDQTTFVATGEVAYVPRWVVHQSRNRSATEPLTLLAITDFGLTSAVLGDYDSRTRLKAGGADVFAEDPQTPDDHPQPL